MHSHETRTDQQIDQTSKNIQRLSSANINRIKSLQSVDKLLSSERAKNCIFICISGIPPFPDEYGDLKLPGKCFQVEPTGFELNITNEKRINRLKQCKYSFQAGKIRKIVDQNLNKSIIFVYHSFGTYMLSSYFHKYGTQRVIGLIELGPAPIRQYRYINEAINFSMNFTEQQLLANIQQIGGKRLSQFVETVNTKLKIPYSKFPSAVHGVALLMYYKSVQGPILFQLNRKYPNVLKFIAFGDQDLLFEKDLLCERADFYAKQELKNQQSLKKKYKQKYNNQGSQNIQQNFIYMIQKGKHSIHLQKKNKQFLRKAVHEYLDLILD